MIPGWEGGEKWKIQSNILISCIKWTSWGLMTLMRAGFSSWKKVMWKQNISFLSSFVICYTLHSEEDLFLVRAFIVGSNPTQHKLFFEHFFSTYDYLQCVRSEVLFYTVHWLIDWFMHAAMHYVLGMCLSVCVYHYVCIYLFHFLLNFLTFFF